MGQFNRVYAMCNNPDTLKESSAAITNTLINSGYPIDVINKAQNRAMINIRPNNNKTISPFHFPKVTFYLPYLDEKSVWSFSRIIRNTIHILRKLGLFFCRSIYWRYSHPY